MARKVNQALREQWRRRIERQRESGLSVVEFCRREGVSPACFHQWKRKLRELRSASPRSSARCGGGPQPGKWQRRAGNRCRPLAIDAGGATGVTSFLQLPVMGARTSPWIELALVDGTIVRVPQQNLAVLQTVLQRLAGRPRAHGGRGGVLCLASRRPSASSSAPYPTDMRRSFDGLHAIVKQTFAKDVFQGDYFVFLNRSRDRCKILLWDRDGLVVWAKRLEQGRFELPSGMDPASLTIEVDGTTLAMILGGVDLKTAKRRKRYQEVTP